MTIAGFHTKHELSELADTFDGFVQSMIATIRDHFAAWQAASPTEAAAWKDRWEVFYPRWYAALQAARAAAKPLVSWDVETAEPDYQALVIAYNPADGDPYGFPALDRDLRALAGAGGAMPAPSYTVAQPTAPDADLGAYKAADAGLKEVQALAKAATPSVGTTIAIAAVALVALALFVKVAK